MEELAEQSLQQAFRLAYFIHGDRRLAIRIATEAAAKLEAAAAAQRKRRYYVPTGRGGKPGAGARGGARTGTRTKVQLDREQLLQRLVFVASDGHERRQEGLEGAGRPDEDDMIIRFVKHLVRITAKRNSFYVSLGVSRLLHDYSTAAAMDLYTAVVCDPDRVPDDYYYRSRKRQLMRELKKRFEGMLKTVRGARGEERFQAREDSRIEALVRRCLERFMPWSTACSLPEGFDPSRQEAPALRFDGGRPDAEHPVEMRRIHTLLHPGCFSRLTAALGLEPPAARLTAPVFALGAEGGSGDGDDGGLESREAPEPLSGEELEAIAEDLRQLGAGRKRHAGGSLAVRIDGEERARFDPELEAGARLELEDCDELVEVFAVARGEEALLASHLLGPLGQPDERAESAFEETVRFRPGAGREVLLRLEGKVGEGYHSLEVTCRAAGPLAALARAAEAAADRLGALLSPAALRPAGALGTLLALAAAGWLFTQTPWREEPQAPEAGSVPRAELRPGASTRGPKSLGPRALAPHLYVAELGSDPFAQELLRHLDEALAERELARVEDPNDAVLALKRMPSEGGRPTLSLVRVDGSIYWTSEASANVEDLAAEVAAQARGFLVQSL